MAQQTQSKTAHKKSLPNPLCGGCGVPLQKPKSFSDSCKNDVSLAGKPTKATAKDTVEQASMKSLASLAFAEHVRVQSGSHPVFFATIAPPPSWLAGRLYVDGCLAMRAASFPYRRAAGCCSYHNYAMFPSLSVASSTILKCDDFEGIFQGRYIEATL